MPLGDRTGPWGLGPMTGRGLGYCAGFPYPGYMNPGYPGLGFGRGFGFGRGYGRGMGFGRSRGWRRAGFFPNIYSGEQEIDLLQTESDILKKQLEEINKRLDELKKKED
ncbi:MAG: DUF5320 domain-containing protein [Acidobacteria bacterium]|nr:DUF5320 domain-containing protein [Acidobacteriota bacterium]